MPTFEIGERDFLLDGRPFQVISGALHYFRVHPDQWAERIRAARLMGLNTIETYVAWNFHAPEPDQFDLGGRRDLGRFLDLVAAEGLHAIVRPGPYICAEWDGGGLPAWLFAADPAGGTAGPAGGSAGGATGVRRHDPAFLDAIGTYYARLLPVVAARQVTRGGPVLMVQVENEYGAYPGVPDDERVAYLRELVRRTREQGIDVPLFTSDQADDEHLSRGGLPELHKTANFGSRSPERLTTLRRHQPTGPLMCMEFWDGWFDSWGQVHHVTAPETTAQDLDDLLAAGASVNLYMFHGGTNLGLTSGANDKGTYLPITTSYDYDAPLSEHGAPTAKFHALRAVIAKHAPVPDELPGDPAPAPVVDVELGRRAALADVVHLLAPDVVASSDGAPTMDALRQWSGFALCSTTVRADDGVLVVDEVRDRAYVALDGDPVGVLDRTTHVNVLPLPRRAGTLTFLVEDRGRVNYGPRIGEPKGLVGPVRTATRLLTDWEAAPLHLTAAPRLLGDVAWTAADPEAPVAGPSFHRGTFDSVAGADHFLRLDGWTRGLVWVNGELLGRYSAEGPTGTLYVPGPLVRAERNELVVLELTGAAAPRARCVPAPDLGPTES
ncbi:beta-galactosidase [Isoptericola sp. NEAU-Y5]|uniref:Beta-galactosidase n=1 Tax=Isoptericola luteus TaxID=2879484 RepID=A0ABS7ZGU3_9MICO|nr:beta-galactosidase family protein [Isoptericola sp. NEAU-Y5]MCA5894235.1 beta-galactosidase [Isoptericola sp. NEAU-Y5]